ncbi:hypothetical protein Cme02nite_15280 [Catellatospora methionotrophica]|uniref:G5 domain-containing protein n=1 Tax=Catellatospora methionotrophica TaxID=121620 RepID=A0A8J3PFG0_9ACTN|nr:G5 domain-containing protein [Catellatospora methionotrophica]GIG13196.1 hypothetical protein Cme02nite_15280 [Catellatospora methionotrophica]
MTNHTPGNPHTVPWQPAPKTGFLASLGPAQKAALFVGGGLMSIVLACCGGSTLIGALGGSPDPKASPAAAAAARPSALPTKGAAAEGLTVSPSAEPVVEPTLTGPVVEKRTVTETKTIAHGVKRVNDSTLAKGKNKVRTQGVNGTKKVTYEVTVTDGVETSRVQVREEITKQPVTEVILVGTKKPSCHPSYTGACVPIASDVDCAGGSGDGPAYVEGPVYIKGSDPYGLDGNGDGVGCE